MTAYNRERYIRAAIESVLTQTFTDYELVVVDDGSQDRTLEIARSYTSDRRVRIIANTKNLGQFPNRNYAAQLAQGEFLKYHDSDDLMYPYCLEIMVELLASEAHADFGLTRGNHWPGGPCPMLLTPRMCYQREFLGSGLFGCGPGGALFRRDFFLRTGGFPDLGVFSDWVFWLRTCARANVLLFPADLIWYRVHPEQELQSARSKRDAATASGEAWRALHAPECPLSPEEREQAKNNWVRSEVKQILAALRAGEWSLAALEWQSCGIPWGAWIRGVLAGSSRQTLAGTPMEDAGEYHIPKWPLGSKT